MQHLRALKLIWTITVFLTCIVVLFRLKIKNRCGGSSSVGMSTDSTEEYPGMKVVISCREVLVNPPVKKVYQSKSCNIPKLDRDALELAAFFKKEKPLDCTKRKKNWLFINDEGNFELIKERKNAECRIVYFKRLGDRKTIDSVEVKVVEGTKMRREYGKVTCTDNWDDWSGMILSAVANDKTVERQSKISPQKDSSGMNVLMLAFDSISRLTFLRKMPKTVNFIEHVLGSVVMEGYNIIGDGTDKAYVPILTGKVERELPSVRGENGSYVDDVFPFVWKNFSDSGYVTAFGEDSLYLGMFIYRMKGFRNSPTDHFLSTFYQQTSRLKDHFCLGSEPTFKSWFRYVREYFKVYPSLPKFLLLHQSMLSHDDVNQIGVQDDFLVQFLERMYNEGILNNTLIILMSDHGSRFSAIRDTKQGMLEERLPFMSFALPPSLTETSGGAKALANLKVNKNRISTPFDIHATLLDVLHWPSEVQLTSEQDLNKRSLSLFRPIPEGRTCTQAQVEPHWCACHDWQASETDEISMKLAHIVVWAMNKQMKKVRDLCSPLELKKLISVKKLLSYLPSDKVDFAYYQLKLSTSPGRGLYEVTLYYDYVDKFVHIDLNTLSHTSTYGNDPHCIFKDHYHLATFCVCYDRIDYSNVTIS